jgi:hypothetical protein
VHIKSIRILIDLILLLMRLKCDTLEIENNDFMQNEHRIT